MYTFKLSFLSIFLIFLALNKIECNKKIYYLYTQHSQNHQEQINKLQKNRENHPVIKVNCQIKTINSKQKDCSKFKVIEYPALVFWNGPGTSYKIVYPPNVRGLHQHFINKQLHPLKDIRDFMQRISLLQAFGVAIAVATVLYSIFSVLFKDRTGLEQAKKKKNL